jgi:integrase/recombinase XerD
MAHNPKNERIKREYLIYLKEARQQSEVTTDAVAKALKRFEEDTKFRDFRSFHKEQAMAFKRRLGDRLSVRTGERLSKATVHATLGQLKAFFQWLAGQPGYKSRLQYSDAHYFNQSDKDARIATTKREQVGPTLEQVKHVLASMPHGTPVERRNRALVAFALVSGARDSAIASMKLKHVDVAARSVYQDAREVNTKNSKTIHTWFFPIGAETQEIVIAWVDFLRRELLWGEADPLFPRTLVTIGMDHQFRQGGLERAHWTTASPIRKVFRVAFNAAGLPYFNPHSFRSTLARLGETRCRTPEEFKAWSQNLGHEKVLTTLVSYGYVAKERQAAIMANLCEPEAKDGDRASEQLVDKIRRLLHQ